MSEEYSYLPPEQVFVNEGGMFEVIAPAMLLSNDEYNRLWVERKKANARHNESIAHGLCL